MGIFQQFPYSNFHEFNLDEIIKIMRQMQDEWANTKSEWASYKDFIDNYFENLDVSEEVLAAMRVMAADGTLNTVMDPVIASTTTQWLIDNISVTIGNTVIDASLSVGGAAADAKAAGDGILGADKNSEIFPKDKITTNYFFDATGTPVGAANTLCISPFIPIKGGAKYHIAPTISVSNTLYHCFYDENQNFISSILSQTKYIRLSLATANVDECMVEYMHSVENVVVFGDSWADTDPNHTVYTKWPALLANNPEYNVMVYAQNGSTIYGDNPNYGLNGNLLGQVEEFLNDAIPVVDTFIINGGINDFRGGTASGYVGQRIQLTAQRLRLNYPNARVIYVANHQLFITDEQIRYFDFVINYGRRTEGVECFDSFGWIPPANFVNDYVHPTDAGYKSYYANILSILEGGDPYTVTCSHNFVSSPSGIDLTVFESWSAGKPVYSAKMTLYTAGFNKTYNFPFATSDNYFLASVPFTKELLKVQPGTNLMQHCCIDDNVAETFSTTYKMNSSNELIIKTASGNSGGYRTPDYI